MQLLLFIVFGGVAAAGIATVRRRLRRNWACPTCGTRSFGGSRPYRQTGEPHTPGFPCRKCGHLFNKADTQPRDNVVRSSHGPQLVGYPCAVCGERIVVEPEAAACEVCGKPVHVSCMPHAHDDGKTPYRD